ncbi:MAG: hypothetical protein ACRBCL_09575 [Maritimibacter sp.]
MSMITRMSQLSLLAAAGFALSGCAIKNAGILAADLASLTATHSGLEATASRDLPGGTARYEGVALVGVQGDALTGAAMMGDAEMTVDFANETASGTITDFVGLPVDNAIETVGTILINPTGLLAQLKRADGEVTFSDPSISGGDIDATLSGDVTLDSVVYGFGGSIAGEVLGESGEAVRLKGDEDSLDMTVDGVAAQGATFDMLFGEVTP